jgi:dihydrofolate reductase
LCILYPVYPASFLFQKGNPVKIIISAMTKKKRLIGISDDLPWNIPDEFNQFLRFIDGQTVIMGRRSYESFPGTLTSAHNIVVSRSVKDLSGAIVCDSLEAAVEKAESFGKTVYISGGATIYAQTLDIADKMYLSYIKVEYPGDVYFPEFDESQWNVEERRDHPEFEFVIYTRKQGRSRPN